jgi:glycosyltransferase involved in cell wall biosynthesis
MADVSAPPASPIVSILLPTYNRARFLPAAFEAMASQSLTSWELIVVDDGSTDETEAVVRDLGPRVRQPVRYIRQANAGAYGARNACLDLASAPYVAFYDSDDLWLPHHLADSIGALEENRDVDWVYAACRIVNHATGALLDANTFMTRGRPRPFRRLHTRRQGDLHIFDDPRVVAWAVRHGLYCGLQNSVIRRSVFDAERFHAAFRNEAEDQLFVVRALKRGHRLAYLDRVHVQYHVHDANSSAPASDQTVERQMAVYAPLVRGFEELQQEFQWSAAERQSLARRVAREHFWHIGYAILWQDGRRAEAIESYRRGLHAWPWSPACWKTYLAARLRVALEPSRSAIKRG